MYHNLNEENDKEDSRLGEERGQKQDCWRRWSLWHCSIGFSDRNPNRPFSSPQLVYLASPEPNQAVFRSIDLKGIESKAELGNWHHTETTRSCIKTAGRFKKQREKNVLARYFP